MAASVVGDAQTAGGDGGGDAVAVATTPVDLALGGKSGDKGKAAKPAATRARKPRAVKDLPAAKPSRTLDMWFKPTGKTLSKSSGGEAKKEDKAAEEPARHVDLPQAAPPKHKASAMSSKKLVQRRIHITDVCRVCDSARTDDASRCELRCIGCDVTVHKKCYNVKDDPPDRTWRCRRCQFALDQKNPSENSEDDDCEDSEGSGRDDGPAVREDAVPDVANTTFPSHDALPESHKYAALHRDPNFASVFRFLQRFRHLGLRVPADLSLHNLANALVSPQESRLCEDLHTKLLATANASANKNYSWSGNMLRFLDSADLDTATLDECTTLSGRDKTGDDRRDDAVYWSLPVRERIAVLKFLCELQFDRNDKLVERIDDEDADAMRDEPIGADASGRAYYVLEDIGTIPNAAAWICRCAKADGSEWETLCDDLESLESLVHSLSLSADTSDLQLWQALSSGVLKKLTRRRKKDQLAKTRLARMPRLLETAGLDASSIIPDGVGVSGRALRSRRQVNYRQLFDEDEEEQDEMDDEQEEEEEEERRPRRGKRTHDSEAEHESGGSDSAASEADEDDDDDDEESLGGSDDDSPHRTTARSSCRSGSSSSSSSSKSRKRAPSSPPARKSKRLRGSDFPL